MDQSIKDAMLAGYRAFGLDDYDHSDYTKTQAQYAAWYSGWLPLQL